MMPDKESASRILSYSSDLLLARRLHLPALVDAAGGRPTGQSARKTSPLNLQEAGNRSKRFKCTAVEARTSVHTPWVNVGNLSEACPGCSD
jgi:hypothetical protein